MKFELDYDPHAARRTVAIPEAKSVNRMKVFGSAALGIPISNTERLRGLARRAAADFVKGERQTFCTQSRDVLEKAITQLELDEPRLAVCVQSWWSCGLLSRTANHVADYAVKVARQSRAAPPAAAADSAASESLPPPPPRQMPPARLPAPLLPAPPNEAGGSAALHRAHHCCDVAVCDRIPQSERSRVFMAPLEACGASCMLTYPGKAGISIVTDAC